MVPHQRTGRHLTHQTRLQLRPFLSEAGLGFRKALRWWEREMRRDPLITIESFTEQVYQLEHCYGKRGHGKYARAFACKKIIGFGAPALQGSCVSLANRMRLNALHLPTHLRSTHLGFTHPPFSQPPQDKSKATKTNPIKQ